MTPKPKSTPAPPAAAESAWNSMNAKIQQLAARVTRLEEMIMGAIEQALTTSRTEAGRGLNPAGRTRGTTAILGSHDCTTYHRHPAGGDRRQTLCQHEHERPRDGTARTILRC